MSAQEAWSLICRLFAGGTPVFRNMLSPAEIKACSALGPAIKPTSVNETFVLCPHCQQHNGEIFSDGQVGRVCRCPDCGSVPLTAEDCAALMLDENWLRSRLRMAMDIKSHDSITELGDGVWRLGDARRAPVLLARDALHLCTTPGVFDRVRVPGADIKLVAPRHPKVGETPFPPGVVWLRLEERFALYGGGISYIAPGAAPNPVADPWTPVNGPFSADFRWVTLAARPNPIHFTEGQAGVLRVLWESRGQPLTAGTIRIRANVDSPPGDLFKVKPRDKGKPEVEDRHFAYNQLVTCRQREGLYWMPCAAGSG